MAFRKSRRLRRNLRKSRKNRNYRRGGERVFDATQHVTAIFTTLASGGDLVNILDTYIKQKVTNGEDQYKLSRAVIGEVNKLTEEELPDRARIIAEISSKYKDPNN